MSLKVLFRLGRHFHPHPHNVISSVSRRAFAALSPTEINDRLRAFETDDTKHVAEDDVVKSVKEDDNDDGGEEVVSVVSVRSPVKSYDKNVLPSNTPCEDSHAEANFDEGMMFGVFDGHGGHYCGQVVSKRLFSYIHAALLPPDRLQRHLAAQEGESTDDPAYNDSLVSSTDAVPFVSVLQSLYRDSYLKYLRDLTTRSFESTSAKFEHAFISLDEDMSAEALDAPEMSDTDLHTRHVALSGAVAAVAHIEGNRLTLAGCGDCVGVIGSLSENNTWVATKLSREHNSDNREEVARIKGEHPGERDIIRGDRLHGILAPLRAFGDFRFKWPADVIRDR